MEGEVERPGFATVRDADEREARLREYYHAAARLGLPADRERSAERIPAVGGVVWLLSDSGFVGSYHLVSWFSVD